MTMNRRPPPARFRTALSQCSVTPSAAAIAARRKRLGGNMSALDDVLRDLVIANRIIAHEGVVDAYGHISARHPGNPRRYLMSRSRSPELVDFSDIMEFELDGTPVGGDKRTPYIERHIHGAIYEARPDVHSVLHSHALDVLPFS